MQQVLHVLALQQVRLHIKERTSNPCFFVLEISFLITRANAFLFTEAATFRISWQAITHTIVNQGSFFSPLAGSEATATEYS